MLSVLQPLWVQVNGLQKFVENKKQELKSEKARADQQDYDLEKSKNEELQR